jgi:hypothetical protein
MNWTTIVAGLIRAFNLIAGWARDESLRRQGRELAQLESLKTREKIRRKADAIDNASENAIDNSIGTDRERYILKRL